MVMKRICSEYMRKFRDPKWETYSRCYEEMLRYRLTRRLLEATHNPWFWSSSDSDSESGERRSPPGTPPPPSRKTRGRCEASIEPDQSRPVPSIEPDQSRPVPSIELDQSKPVPRLPLLEPEVHGSYVSAACRERTSSRGSKHLTVPHTKQDREHNEPPFLSKPTWRSPRVQPAEALQPGCNKKDCRHPFALYGSGEKNADIAGRKTHNVSPAASTNEIHESALRAKSRREVKHQVQSQVYNQQTKRRAKSTGLDESRNLVQMQFNPWITEYMHCFSAHC